MDIALYLEPIEHDASVFPKNSLGANMAVHNVASGFPDMDGVKVAIVGVKEERGAVSNEGCANSIEQIRSYLYQLFPGEHKMQLADLGNLLAGKERADTYFALSKIVSELIRNKIFPLIIGGSQDLTYANYLAYEELEQVINFVSIDNSFDLGKSGDGLSATSYLNKIILRQPNYLFNYSNIGYQAYFIDEEELHLMSKLYFDTHRLGEVRANLQETEPILRNADMLSVDIAAVRQSDAPGCGKTTPNGFYGEELCQMMRYAGLSDKLTSLGVYEVNPDFDNRGQTAHLVAQMIWCFLDGYYNRKGEFPMASKKEYLKYNVSFQDLKNEMIFYKSIKSDRWWIHVPYPPNNGMRYQRHQLVPCSYDDYKTACNDDIPNKWWKTYQKLS